VLNEVHAPIPQEGKPPARPGPCSTA
jgi:hypothetical protein